ncbi:MAG: ribonuclease R [Nitrospirae bacterium]|nr:ribonuclease R [Nitrospirota bacterium]
MEKITKDTIIKVVSAKGYRPLLFKELIDLFDVPPKKIRKFKELLKELLLSGAVIKTRENRYALPSKINLITGALSAHPDGYAFVIPEDNSGDIFIPSRKMLGAMDGDKVVARIEKTGSGNKREGRIIRILERAHAKIVGKFERSKGFGFVMPSDPKITYDIYVHKNNWGNAKDGEIVVAEIIGYPRENRNPEGRIVRILGHPEKKGIELELIMEEYELTLEFPEDVKKEAEGIPSFISEDEIGYRKDLRHIKTVTIDGEKAKDFDDAVSIKKEHDGHYTLWVHIADVSYYVKKGAPLDKEALKRGTSVYFPDMAIPMLPYELSNDICSLKPRVDRLTLTAEMRFDKKGKRIGYKFYNSCINSNERMTYTQVKEMLVDNNKELHKRYMELIPDFKLMEELAILLSQQRWKRGSIDFDLPEPAIILDIQGRPTDIIKEERNIAHKIIEEFMIAANEAVASYITSLEIPSIYRIHERPDEDKIGDFAELIKGFGLFIKGGDGLKPKSLQKILEDVKDKPEEKLVNHILLRSMKQARYFTENIGHFGLASDAYTHFTSPIRRYPDLVVHRILKMAIGSDKFDEREKAHLNETLPQIAQHSSERERTSMEAERAVVSLYKINFIRKYLGEEYPGHISGVTAFGFFVELDNIFIEGLVHITRLYDDFYIFHEKDHSLIGMNKKRRFKIGDKIIVRVDSANAEKRQIDFSLVEKKH